MNKLFNVLMVCLALTLIAVPAFPLSYEIDVGQDGTFETGGSVDLNINDSVTMDIYVDGYSCSPVPPCYPCVVDGLFGTLKYILLDESQVTVSGFPFDTGNGGPWDPSFSQFAQQETNVYFLGTGNFSYVTVVGNKQKLGTMTLTCNVASTFTLVIANDLTSYGYSSYSDGLIADCNLASQCPADALLTVNAELCEIDDDCNDNNLCTTDSCNTETNRCVYTPVQCDDSNLCTSDSCNPANGNCEFISIDCNDGNLCTIDSCNPSVGCVNTPLDCDDNNLCTIDACSPATGECTYTWLDCDDGNTCTSDSCDQFTGCVNNPVEEGTPCDDGTFCNGADTCSADGICIHPGDPCTDDALYCNGIESCDETNDICLHSGNPCFDDGLFCTGIESCNEDIDECVSSGNPCIPPAICDEGIDICLADTDADGIHDHVDNCPNHSNAPGLGTCLKIVGGVFVGTNVTCTDEIGCKPDEICDMMQFDFNSNGIGDACECYADCNCDTKIDLSDVVIMKTQFLRDDCPACQ